MEALIVIAVLVLIGLIAGYVAGLIWKDNRPYGIRGDYIIAVVSTVIIGLMSWYLIPLMGFSDTLKYISFALEPFFGALLILWVVRKAKQS